MWQEWCPIIGISGRNNAPSLVSVGGMVVPSLVSVRGGKCPIIIVSGGVE
ncbi:unnamed protein product [Staurois parvus]|uniref:Uncharacterized protein n=1 Tax=Staurois parvus TaxID=386267 RepID=A0ABN9G5N2_9NEOB|nr:unnamed protein product [Staurois parvus]